MDQLPAPLRLVLAGRHDRWLDGHASRWQAWDAFADHHDLDPEDPQDHQLVAFVTARALAGVSVGTLEATLTTIRLAVEHTPQLTDTSVTLPAARQLRQLWDDGNFDPTLAAPLLTLGEILALATAAASRANRQGRPEQQQTAGARDRMLTVVGYTQALRPGEWVWPDREHIEPTTHRGRRAYRLVLPRTKTDTWVALTVTTPSGLPTALDPVAAIDEYLELRGEPAGPLVIDAAAPGARLRPEFVQTSLRSAAAAAGLTAFSSYSLRRSRATHAALAGASSTQIRRLLRHRPDGVVVRRYIEPLLAVMDRGRAAAHFLDPTVPQLEPVGLDQVGGRRRVPPLAFAAGPVEQLLDGIDLPALRVPAALVPLASSTIDRGRQSFRRFSSWAQQQGHDPAAPGEWALTMWALAQLDDGRPAISVATELSAVRIGWIDATRSSSVPGYAEASELLDGAQRSDDRQVEQVRQATDDDAIALLPQVPAPTLGWAQTVLLATCRPLPRQTVTLLEVDADTVEVVVGGRPRRLGRGPGGMVCPVIAAQLLIDAGLTELQGSATWKEVAAAAAARSVALRDRLLVTLLRGSGARPSDLSRARLAGVCQQPGGLAVVLGARKGRKPGDRVAPELLWAPERDGELDPVAGLEDWLAWWAYEDGPLLPGLGRHSQVAEGRVEPWKGLRSHLVTLIAQAGLDLDGLTPKSFRVAVATESVAAGLDLEAVAERLGHSDSRTTRGYLQDWDPFVGDGLDDDQLVGLVAEVIA